MTDEHNDNNKEIEIKNDYENKTENTKTNENFSNEELFINNVDTFENKKEIKTNPLILNEFWVHLISKIMINLSLIYYELIPCSIYLFYQEKDFNSIFSSLYKYIFIIQFVPQFSIILYSLTTFSTVIKKTNKIKKFFLINIIKAIIFYLISLIILKLIKNNLYNFLCDEISKIYIDDKIKEILENFRDFLLKFIGNFLANFNTNLDILIVGSMYIFLFKNPKKIAGKKLFYFRLMSIFPILFVLISIIFRALVQKNVIKINIFIYPIFVGSKVSIFGFFITTLLYLKYISKEYFIFDENNYILPKVFSKIGGKIFSYFAYAELIFEYIIPNFKFIGLGKQYLSIFAVPLVLLYDYKKKKIVHWRICKKRKMNKFINFLVSFILYFFIIILGLIVLGILSKFIKKYIEKIVKYIKENKELVKNIIQFMENTNIF